MPVIIPLAAYESWLDPDNTSGRGLETLLQPYLADALRAYAVSPRVNNVRNNDATLFEAVPPSAILAPTLLQGQLL
jgi:putative SOS response-associated peptidase YedK